VGPSIREEASVSFRRDAPGKMIRQPNLTLLSEKETQNAVANRCDEAERDDSKKAIDNRSGSA
jgi:hypothetical protein